MILDRGGGGRGRASKRSCQFPKLLNCYPVEDLGAECSSGFGEVLKNWGVRGAGKQEGLEALKDEREGL